jgi:hypothetical protein
MTRARDLSNDEANSGGATPPFVAGKNRIINGDFGIWQRGTTFNSVGDNLYTADRFRQNGNGSGVTKNVSRQTFTPGTAPVAGYEGTYFYRFNQSVAGTGTSYQNMLIQCIEDVRAFSGQTVTVSFWAKADTTRTITVVYGQEFGNSGVGDQYPTLGTAAVTTNWARYSVTGTIASVAGKTIGANTNNFQVILSSPFNVVQTIDVWGLQIEAGSVATPFTPAGGGFPGAELALCQRYYTTSIPTGFTVTDFSGMNQGSSSAVAWCSSGSTNDMFTTIQYPVPMRAAPTFVIYSAGNRTAGSVRDAVTGSDLAVGNYSVQAGNNKGFNYMSGFTATTGRPYSFQWTASAEL